MGQRDVANFVHCNATHPAITRSGRERALLENERIQARAAYFIPAHADASAGIHRVVDDDGLVVPKVVVCQAVHKPVAQGIQLLSGSRLLYAFAAVTPTVKTGDSYVGRPGERGI